MDAQKKEKSCNTLQKPLSIHDFFQTFEFFRASTLFYLSNMVTSFCDKVPVFKDKTKCEGSSTFGEGL